MFNIGDKIVYPSQGVGIIENIEEKEFNGEMKTYYNIHIVNSTMKLMLPESRLGVCNIRLISDEDFLDTSLNKINDYTLTNEECSKGNCKQRILDNTAKFKSGTLKDYLEVISTLTQVSKIHNLNSSEKQLLNNTKKIFTDEIASSKNISNDDAISLLEKYLNS